MNGFERLEHQQHDAGSAEAPEIEVATVRGLHPDGEMEYFAGRLLTPEDALDAQFEASENGMGM